MMSPTSNGMPSIQEETYDENLEKQAELDNSFNINPIKIESDNYSGTFVKSFIYETPQISKDIKKKEVSLILISSLTAQI